MKCEMNCLECPLPECIYDNEDNWDRSNKIIHTYANKVLGERLNKALSSKGMKQIYLARITGLTAPTICAYVNGSRTPRADHIVVICNALDISADWLLGMENEND